MSLRIRCRNCQATFVTSDDQAGQSVACPKCDAKLVVPGAKSAAADSEAVESGPALSRIKSPAPAAEPSGGSIFIPKAKKPKGDSGKSRPWFWPALLASALALVGVMIAWPALMKWWNPRPNTMVEGAAYDYLQALATDDKAAIARIGVVEEPPAIRSFRDLRRDNAANAKSKGEFATIGRLHRSIEKTFVYDPSIGRFTPKNPLGPAAETLDALHEAKAKNEKDKTYEKMASGDPNEAMDAAISFGEGFAKLSEGILNPKRLIPSYKMLVQNAKPPLTGTELALALDYANHREVWDALLKRPFPTLKADGPFQFEKAELTAQVTNKLASSGEPPSTVRLRLVRFRMDAIDTGWKVVAARRVQPGQGFEPEMDDVPETPPEPPKPSPGEIKLPTDLIPADLPRR